MTTLGQVAVEIVSQTGGDFDAATAAAIDRGLIGPMTEAVAVTDELAERWARLGGPEMSPSIWRENRVEMEGFVAQAEAAAASSQNLGAEFVSLAAHSRTLSAVVGPELSQAIMATQRVMATPTPLGFALAGAAGLVAVMGLFAQARRAAAEAREEARRFAVSLVDAQEAADSEALADLTQQIRNMFTPTQRRLLAEWGVDLRRAAVDTDYLRSALNRLRDEAPGTMTGADIINLDQFRPILEEIEQAVWDAAQRRIDIAWFESRKRKEIEDTSAQDVANAVDRIVSEWDRLQGDAESLREGLTSSFAGWVDILNGVPDQVQVSAAEIARNAADAAQASAQLTLNWVNATEAGAENVAAAILEAGPSANQAFSDLLSNPTLLAATENSLASTFDLAARVAEEQVDRIITPQVEAMFHAEAVGLGRDGMLGVAEGLRTERVAAAAAMVESLRYILNAGKASWQIKSPSRQFRDGVGAPAMLGVAEGIRDKAQIVSDTLRAELVARANSVVAPVSTAARAVGGSMVGAVAQGITQAEGVLARATAELTRDVAQRQLAEARKTFKELSKGLTLEQIVGVERAERDLRRLQDQIGGIADAEKEVAQARLDAAAAQAQMQTAAEAWDYRAFTAAQEQLKLSERLIESRERWLEGARESAASEAELALAAQRVAEAQDAPNRERIEAAEELRRAQLALLRADLGLAGTPKVEIAVDSGLGERFDALLRKVAAPPPKIDLHLNFTDQVTPQSVERAIKRAVAAALKAYTDGLAAA